MTHREQAPITYAVMTTENMEEDEVDQHWEGRSQRDLEQLLRAKLAGLASGRLSSVILVITREEGK